MSDLELLQLIADRLSLLTDMQFVILGALCGLVFATAWRA